VVVACVTNSECFVLIPINHDVSLPCLTPSLAYLAQLAKTWSIFVFFCAVADLQPVGRSLHLRHDHPDEPDDCTDGRYYITRTPPARTSSLEHASHIAQHTFAQQSASCADLSFVLKSHSPQVA
jgi:hypothetical protein